MSTGNMILHCGGATATFEEVQAARTPKAIGAHYPIPHSRFVDIARKHLTDGGLEIQDEQHALHKDGQRYFGLLGLNRTGMNGTYQWAIGLRNTHDKSYRAALVAGTRVFVCDNLAFSGEIEVLRMHTKHAERDLGNMFSRAVGQLGDLYHDTEKRYTRYRETNISDRDANDLIIRAAVDSRAVMPSQIPRVVSRWREPEQDDFKDRNLWSLFNAFTEQHKDLKNENTLINRGQALHGVFDIAAGLELN